MAAHNKEYRLHKFKKSTKQQQQKTTTSPREGGLSDF